MLLLLLLVRLSQVLVLLLPSSFCLWNHAQLLDPDSWDDRMSMFDGLCHYGNSVECCWGWRQSERGRCQPYCQQGCKHGVCVGPDRCKCQPGYSGKACNQDLNECGLKPRPCKHRCMNTPGSYKCYCLNGYALQPDGSCRNARTCYHANCQYGCEVSKGVVRCTCPSPGLQLGPDKRTCVDIDECALGATCPRHRKCVNTFGSFLCKCHYGFKLTYINGRYVCIDKDTRSFCSLNPSSPKCRCKNGRCSVVPNVTLMPPRPKTTTTSSSTTLSSTTAALSTVAASTTALTTVAVTSFTSSRHISTTPVRTPPTTPRTTPSMTVPKSTYSRPPAIPTTATVTPSGEPFTLLSILTTLPDPSNPTTTVPNTTSHSTPTLMPPIPSTTHPITTTIKPSTPNTTPTSPKPYTVLNSTPATTPTTVAPTVTVGTTLLMTTTIVTTTLNNRIDKDVTHKQRGDVHIPRHPDMNHVWEFDIELGNTAEEDAMDDPNTSVLRCTFDHGRCDWLSDREGDLHWETSRDNTGGGYLYVPELKAGQKSVRGARMAVQVPKGWSRGVLCFSFSHWLTGHNVGVLQLFVKRRGRDQRYSPTVWSRTGGHGWRHTQVTLTTPTLDQVLLKADRKHGRQGRIAVDDVALRRGACR